MRIKIYNKKMEIKKIITARKYEKWPSYDLVYEWEDIFNSKLKTGFFYDCKNKLKKVPLINNLFVPKEKSFIYEMGPQIRFHIWNKKNIIPCIIDFFLKKEDLESFYHEYKKNPIVLISSKEVFQFLNDNGCPLNIAHFPLSISDIYKIDSNTSFKKIYDLVMVGRQNPVLEKYTKKYALSHPDFLYVYRKLQGKDFMYYTSDGRCLGNIDTREQYMSLLKKSRCGIYATPGIDGGEKRTNGFSQVTPRFLEMLACGCHIIARYKKNADTDFYQLKDFSPSVETYEEFEHLMDNARKEEVNINKYIEYLSNHYTSKRIETLKYILNKI